MNLENCISLTGDRPTGCLHLGHYVGSIKSRLDLQNKCKKQFIMLADLQAMVNDSISIADIQNNIIEVMKDYLSTGLLPEKNTFFVQSSITPLHEMVTYYTTLLTLSHLRTNPTIRQEMHDKLHKMHHDFHNTDAMQAQGSDKAPIHNDNKTNHEHTMQDTSINMHFLLHPVSQAADITAFNSDVIPVGEDQLPLIHLTNDIVDRFNHKYGQTLKNVKPILSTVVRLSGIDGKAKASKSLNNAIFLSDPTDVVKQKVGKMYTDPDHIHVSQPGKVEGNVVFEYLDAFHEDQQLIQELKQKYMQGGLGDVYLKNLLFEALEKLLAPIRERRAQITDAEVKEILVQGNADALSIANQTLHNIKRSMGMI